MNSVYRRTTHSARAESHISKRVVVARAICSSSIAIVLFSFIVGCTSNNRGERSENPDQKVADSGSSETDIVLDPTAFENEGERVAALRNVIAAKEMELALLKASLRSAQEKPRVPFSLEKGVCRTPEELLAGMPQEAFPSASPENGLERRSALEWCEKHLVGRVIEWNMTLKPHPQMTSKWPFEVTFTTLEQPAKIVTAFSDRNAWQFGQPLEVGGEPVRFFFNWRDNESGVTVNGLSATEARNIRTQQGQSQFRAQIVRVRGVFSTRFDDGCMVECYKGDSMLYDKYEEMKEGCVILFDVTQPSINGFVASSFRAYMEKFGGDDFNSWLRGQLFDPADPK